MSQLPQPKEGIQLLPRERIVLTVPVSWIDLKMRRMRSKKRPTPFAFHPGEFPAIETRQMAAAVKKLAKPDSTLAVTDRRLLWARGTSRRTNGTPTGAPLRSITSVVRETPNALKLTVGNDALIYMGKEKHLDSLVETLARQPIADVGETSVYVLRGTDHLVCSVCGWLTLRTAHCGCCGLIQDPQLRFACNRCREILTDPRERCRRCGATPE
jgi:hypothetical protein